MFQGHSICSIDAKSRIVLPAKFRKYIKPEVNNKLIIIRGMEKCLWMYTYDVWEEFKSTVLKKNNPFDEKQRFFMREFLYFVNEVELDSQNRILIPPQLIQFANLKKEAEVLGLIDMIEIWDPEEKQKYLASQTETFENVAQKLGEIFMNKNA
jgi:MraZ protein